MKYGTKYVRLHTGEGGREGESELRKKPKHTQISTEKVLWDEREVTREGHS